MRKVGISIGLLLLSGMLGCSSIGPLTIRRDRLDYTDAISDSWKSQMLLNMVKLRYGDTPMFLDVSSVAGKYDVNGSSTFGFNWAPGVNSPSLDVTGSYADRPAISYAPMTGEKFARNLMTPIQACNLFSLVQAGFPIDLVLRSCVVSINGIHNHYAGLSHYHQADNDFFVICNQLRGLQDAGALELRFNKPVDCKKHDNKSPFLEFVRRILSRITGKKADEKKKGDTGKKDGMYICVKEDKAKSQMDLMIDTLRLDPPQPKYGYEIINNLGERHSDKYAEIGILTQSVLGVIVDFASCIKVPKVHVLEGRVREDFKDTVPNAPAEPIIRIDAVEKKPSNSFAAVRYKKYWFYIDDRDFQSKRAFTFLMFLLSLTETGDKDKTPILTIPVG